MTDNKHFGDVWVYIDNSNLWIQGQRTYAEKNKMKVSWDPTWRFDVGRLKEILMGQSGLTAEEKMFEVKVELYGSTPPPVDTVWKAIESHNVKVNKFARSSWTNREKQVDNELNGDSIDQANKSFYQSVPAVFVIVSGDRDLLSAVTRITQKGFKVHLWSWKNGLASVYEKEQDERIDWSLFQVHLLDDYLETIGFKANTFRVDRNILDPHGIVVLDPLTKVDEVEEFLDCLGTPFYRYKVVSKRPGASSHDLVIIPAHARSMEHSELRKLFAESKAWLERDGVNVLSYLEYSQNYLHSSNDVVLERWEQFKEWPEEMGDNSTEKQKPVAQDADKGLIDNGGDGDSDGFIDVNRGLNKRRNRLKKTEDNSRRRCHWRLYCSRALDCKWGHTKAEEDYFRVYGNKRPLKFQLCRRDDCIRGKACNYAHGPEELFCPTCDQTGAHEMRDCPERAPNARWN